MYKRQALYWIATSLLSSISPENFIQQWGESDFAITYSIHDDGSPITADKMCIRDSYSGDSWTLTFTGVKVGVRYHFHYELYSVCLLYTSRCV